MTGTTTATPDVDASVRRITHPFAWQGWRLAVPASWNAVKLEGGFAKGHALLADLDGPRLGLRWQTVEAKRATRDTLDRVVRDEVGAQATRTLGDAVVYLDPEPPGRDVAARWFSDSGRLIQIAYHARRRDGVLLDDILPSLSDVSTQAQRPWAVFNLACAAPRDLRLASHRLNAGDLSLEFAGEGRFVVVQQVALAEIALRRTPLAHWLKEQQRARQPRYRAIGEASPFDLKLRDGRAVSGLIGRMRRRLRFRSTEQRVILALHDEPRDRLVLIEASDETLARDVAQTVGCDLD